MNGIVPAPSGVPRPFAPRPVGLDQFASLLHESAAILGRAPGRLFGLFLLVFLPIQILPSVPYAAMPLRTTLATIGFAGFFRVLESVRHGRPATLADMIAAWKLPADKLVLLAASGLLPLLAALLLWWFDMGGSQLDAYLGGREPGSALGLRQQVEFVVVLNLAGMPLLFVQPLCVLCAWSGTRTLSANLIAWIANWRWALLLTLVLIPLAIGLDSFDPENALEILLSLGGEIVVEIALSAFTLVLLQRSLEAK